MKLSRLSPAVAAIAIAASSGAANADVFVFHDLEESVFLTVNGVVVSGNGGRIHDFSASGESISFSLGDIVTQPTSVSYFYTNLLDPGPEDTPGTVSDRFLEKVSVFVDENHDVFHSVHVVFGSDPDLPEIPTSTQNVFDLTTFPAQGLPANPYYENGKIQLVATVFALSSKDSVDKFYIQSDVSVPEPTTWALMLLGFGGVGAKLRRWKSSATLAA